MSKANTILALVTWLVLPFTAGAAENTDAPKLDQVLTAEAETRTKALTDKQALQTLSNFALLIRQNEGAGRLSAEEAKAVREIAVMLAAPYGDYTIEDLERFNARQAIFSWKTILLVAASLVGVAGILLFITLMFQSTVPLELFGYLAGGALMLFGGSLLGSPTFLGIDPFWGVFVGGLLFSVTFGFSYGGRGTEGAVSVIPAVLALLWAILAIVYNSRLFGFIAVGAFETWLGFAILPFGWGYLIGWGKDDQMERGTLASFFLLVAGIVLAAFGPTLSTGVTAFLAPFTDGLLLIGGVVTMIGVLIMSTKWYRAGSVHWPLNIVMLGLIAGCYHFGTVYSVPYIAGVAGWLGFFFLLDKWIEISFNQWAWAFSLIGIAGMLYGLARVIETYPDLFRVWL